MAPKVHRQVALGLALCAALTVGGCLGYEGDFDRGYQVDENSVSQLKVGATTKPEALALFGTPSTTSTVGGDAWYYIGQKMQHTLSFMPVKMTDQHVLAVYFDKSGKVDRVANYGMKDGRYSTSSAAPRRPAARSPISSRTSWAACSSLPNGELEQQRGVVRHFVGQNTEFEHIHARAHEHIIREAFGSGVKCRAGRGHPVLRDEVA